MMMSGDLVGGESSRHQVQYGQTDRLANQGYNNQMSTTGDMNSVQNENSNFDVTKCLQPEGEDQDRVSGKDIIRSLSMEAPPPLKDCTDVLSHVIMNSFREIQQGDDCSTDGCESFGSRPQHELSQEQSKPRLTLSAFRRPEESIRVADPDRTRRITDHYILSTGIGHGAMSTVRLAERTSDGTRVAVKTVSKPDVLRSRRFRRSRRHLDEWEALRLLKGNPNVVDLIDVYETDDEVQMVLEYCKGGELYDYIQRKRATKLNYYQSEAQAAKLVAQVLSVLNDLHGRGMVHRDVKPENLLLTSCEADFVKLCDFGICRHLLDESDADDISSSDGDDSPITPTRARAYSKVGSDLYAAPEVCMGDSYSTAVDVYSLGVTLYVLLCGFPPDFDLQDDGEAGVSFPDPQWSEISDECKHLICRMLEPDPEQRITAEKALSSEWIKRHAGVPRFAGTNNRHAAQRRSSHLFSHLSPTKPRPVVDLELVKARLYKNMEIDRKHSFENADEGTRKRRRMPSRDEHIEDESSFMTVSMADFYRGVASAAECVTKAANGVVCEESKNTVTVVVDDSNVESDIDNDVLSDGDVDNILGSPPTALSV